MPAFEQAFADHAAEIAAITNDPAAPDFANTITALERSGKLLSKVSAVFYDLVSAHSNPALLEIDKEVSLRMARHWNPIMMNAVLFGRIVALHDNRATLGLTGEQARLLERTYTRFHRSGAGLDEQAKARMAEINERLAHLGTAFGHHLLGDEQDWFMELGEADRGGLSDSFVAAAKAAAEERGMAGKAVMTLSRSFVEPFLKSSTRRDLREKVFKAFTARGDNGNANDNNDTIVEILALARGERKAARLPDLRGLPAGRFHGQDAGGGARPAGAGLEARPRPGAGRSRRAAGAGRRGGRQFCAGAVGLALLRRKAAADPRQFRRRRDQALSRARPHDRRRVRLRDPAVRPPFCRAQRHPGLASRRPGLGGQGRRGKPQGAILWRLFCAALETLGRLDDLAARPAEARWRRRAPDHQCLQFLQGRRGPALAAVAGRCAHAVPRIRPRPARHAVGRDLPLAVRHLGVHRFRRTAVAALRALAGAAAGAAPVRAALSDRRAAAGRSVETLHRRAKIQPGFCHGRVRLLRA